MKLRALRKFKIKGQKPWEGWKNEVWEKEGPIKNRKKKKLTKDYEDERDL